MRILLIVLSLFTAFSCKTEDDSSKASLIIHGGTIYTVDEVNPQVEAVAIKDNIILFSGSMEDALNFKGANTEMLDLDGKTMTPGFIEGHGHLMGLGYNELELDLSKTTSYQDIIDLVEVAAKNAKPGEWILGRGWHQSKWSELPASMVKGFQTHEALSAVSPNNPVYLGHASGHAGFANAKAMELAGVTAKPAKKVDGGEIIRYPDGRPTGIFNERAQSIIGRAIPEDSPERIQKAFESAIEACHRNGITSFHDAGIYKETIELYKKMKADGKLKVRLHAMLSSSDSTLLEEWYKKGPSFDEDNLLNIRAIKIHSDGALGSRGAWLLEEYSDMPGHFGHSTIPLERVENIVFKALENGFQVGSHAIGDRANREILDKYELGFEKYPNKSQNHRFRIEHAQHLNPSDIPRFAELNVIPAMQGIHMSSDRPWAIDRLGEQRIKEGAYMWQSLLKSGVPIVNGTDVPVESINPIACFYASVSRKTLKGIPENGYESEQKMTRVQALKSYTIDAAYGAFDEEIKGSIMKGKLADFTIFDQDIMTIPEADILKTKVAMTIFDGQVVYTAK
ncbi:amidohydrolase [Arcticibacterium luteifluviistationis]|uniref:Amidohydrolase n=1 Tax=Arcticibacterium luteifluviistationis TaxID=1784714 RepID=A0A2Z4G7P1_9BACT|nr:amidohydrolase [Arcticibacterium luteifluviistationis]AWV97189.1 amidohydrolase [Arcticibacterium luteifluviistationis]